MNPPPRSAPNRPTAWLQNLRTAVLVLGCSAGLAGPPALRAADGGEITAVASKVSEDYVRAKRPDGSYELEGYVFGEGGLRSYLPDPTIDKMKFAEVARPVAAALSAQNYAATRDLEKARLLIMVYWGTTAGTSSGASSAIYQNLQSSQGPPPPPPPPPPSNGAEARAEAAMGKSTPPPSKDDGTVGLTSLAMMQNRLRERTNMLNAGILGFEEDLADTQGLETSALGRRRGDLINDLEDNRYFVVLMAYDFQLMMKEKKPKLLWETRFSIRERRNDFGEQLAGMAQSASRYFGKDSHGLRHKPLPEGHVKLDELKIIGVEPDKPEK